MFGLFHGKSHLEMDDNWGYPNFRKPPNMGNMFTIYKFKRHLDASIFGKKLDVGCEELTTTSLIKPSQVRQDNLQTIYVDSHWLTTL